jgi:hypothetical protein
VDAQNALIKFRLDLGRVRIERQRNCTAFAECAGNGSARCDFSLSCSSFSRSETCLSVNCLPHGENVFNYYSDQQRARVPKIKTRS